jgi:hypothetical protein
VAIKKLPRCNRLKGVKKMGSKIKPWNWSEFGVSNIDKTQLTEYYYKMLLNRVINMFTWKNLPDTIDEQIMNFWLFVTGRVVFTEFKGKLYALNGNYGGYPNEYYLPTEFVIANPILGSKIVKLDVDGVAMFNSDTDKYPTQTMTGGLYPILTLTANMLADCVVTISSALKNGRVQTAFLCKDDTVRIAGEKVLKQLYNGNPAVMIDDTILNCISPIKMADNTSVATILQQTIETYQFWLANFYNSIGVNANFNMKRERLNTAEVNINDSALFVNVVNMLNNRQQAVNKINAMFGTNITVEISEEWKDLVKTEEEPAEEEPTEEEGNDNAKDDNAE